MLTIALIIAIRTITPATAGDLAGQTADGRPVTLKEDGTWVFVPAAGSTADAGFTVEAWGERLVLGGPAEDLIKKFSCTVREGASLPHAKALYDCQAPRGPIGLALTNSDTLLQVVVEGSGKALEQIRAMDDAHMPRLGKPISTLEENGDCPYSTSRYKAGMTAIDVTRFNGCYDEEDPNASLTFTLVVK